MTDKLDEALKYVTIVTGTTEPRLKFPDDDHARAVYQAAYKYHVNAWKIERFDALAKAEAEGEIAVVPVEPTEEMLTAAFNTGCPGPEGTFDDFQSGTEEEIYEAMLNAAGPSKYLTNEGDEK